MIYDVDSSYLILLTLHVIHIFTASTKLSWKMYFCTENFLVNILSDISVDLTNTCPDIINYKESKDLATPSVRCNDTL